MLAADRNFLSYDLLKEGLAAGVHVLWLNYGTLNRILCDVTGFGAPLAAPTPLTTGTWYHLAYIGASSPGGLGVDLGGN